MIDRRRKRIANDKKILMQKKEYEAKREKL